MTFATSKLITRHQTKMREVDHTLVRMGNAIHVHNFSRKASSKERTS